ncbi:ATP7B [Cordylochernes scorpioides]|uniref:P-type Cu(+) transporter n=1 Tax=Cordylochernes scorpioides TaxID=51811 RepID=A0ABY6KTZ4_9ARAC|nr:ATP7B [Cordylochernes scorpioides]
MCPDLAGRAGRKLPRVHRPPAVGFSRRSYLSCFTQRSADSPLCRILFRAVWLQADERRALLTFDDDAVSCSALMEEMESAGLTPAPRQPFSAVEITVPGMEARPELAAEVTARLQAHAAVERVELRGNTALVTYRHDATSPAALRDVAHASAELLYPERDRTSCRLSVHGMTCESCVSRITEHLMGLPGVAGAAVNLAERLAVVDYDPALTSALTLQQAVQSLGKFTAAVLADGEDPARRVCTIEVLGMTCNSCVENIQDKVGVLLGVSAVSVSLEDAKATVLFNPQLVSAAQLTETIDDMGFDARLLQDIGVQPSSPATAAEPPRQSKLLPLNHNVTLHCNTVAQTCCIPPQQQNLHERTADTSIQGQFSTTKLLFNQLVANVPEHRTMGKKLSRPRQLHDHRPGGRKRNRSLCRHARVAVSHLPSLARADCPLALVGAARDFPRPPARVAASADPSTNERLIVVGDTVIVVGDTVIVVGDTLIVVGDTIIVVGATLIVVGDTVIVVGDTLIVVGDTVIVVEDTLNVVGDSFHVVTFSENDTKKSCYLTISNMTCSSCVIKIQNKMHQVPGVENVMIALMSEKAKVIYDPELLGPEEIAQKLTAIGFPSAVIDQPEGLNRILKLHIDGLSSKAKRKHLKKGLYGHLGVVKVESKVAKQHVNIHYNYELTKPRAIVKLISDLGFHATPIDEKSKEIDRLRHTEEIKMWRRISYFNLLVGGPSILYHLSMILHLHIPLPGLGVPGLSFISLVDWLAATLILLYSGRPFYSRALTSLRHRMLNMDFLIMTAMSLCYMYSFILAVYSIYFGSFPPPKLFFGTIPMLLLFISFGRLAENKCKGHTSQALIKIIGLQSSDTLLVTLDSNHVVATEEQISTAYLQEGDLIKVGLYAAPTALSVKVVPGAKIPVDGKVVTGSSTVDESVITGESLPSIKKPGDGVIAGTMNMNGVLVVMATQVGADTTLAQIVKLMEDAQTSKAPIQQIADKMSGYFVQIVFVIFLATCSVWLALGYTMPQLEEAYFVMPRDGATHLEIVIHTALQYGLTVLSISCPCALGLATPTAITVATGIGTKYGILIKGGEPLETLSKAHYFLFDKTGTLTFGKPSVTSITMFVKEAVCSAVQMLALVGTAEHSSEHPIAMAVDNFMCDVLGVCTFGRTEDFSIVPGCGLRCKVSLAEPMVDKVRDTVPDSLPRRTEISSVVFEQKLVPQLPTNGLMISDANAEHQVVVGNREWMRRNGMEIPKDMELMLEEREQRGETAVLASINGAIVAMITVADTVRPEAQLTIQTLRAMEKKVMLLTGDNPRTAANIAQQVGITEVYSELLPTHKVLKVKQLKTEGFKVAMVGDGVNDSPALAQADVGIAVGSGSDIAREAAQVVLIRNNLLEVITALQISRKTISKIRLNFLSAVIYNVFAIPFAAGVLTLMSSKMKLEPWMGGAAMCFSSLSVVFFSQLLRRYRRPSQQALEEAVQKARLPIEPLRVHKGLEQEVYTSQPSKSAQSSLSNFVVNLLYSPKKEPLLLNRDLELAPMI